MLGGRAGELVSRRETPSQCGRVGSPEFCVVRIILIGKNQGCLRSWGRASRQRSVGTGMVAI